MPLSIRFHHRPEALVGHLIARLASSHPDPLSPLPIIAPSVGVGRWIQHCVARTLGVSAGIPIVLPGSYLWQIIGRVLDQVTRESPFAPERLRWSLLRVFESLAPVDASAGAPGRGPAADPRTAQLTDAPPELDPLISRLEQADDVERFALADALAHQFDRYGSWRRDWLARWESGAWAQGARPISVHEPWQRWLWNALRREGPTAAVSGPHPYDRLAAAIRNEPERLRRVLAGERISIFGPVSMSTEQFDLYRLLGEVCDVAFFCFDPCREFWEDLSDSRTIARIRVEHPDEAWLYEGEPAILGDWGRAHRDHIVQVNALAERSGIQVAHDRDAFDQPWSAHAPMPQALSCLQALQAAVFLRTDEPWMHVGQAAFDHSIEWHAAHSVLRQAEVLHERLLACFAELPDLQPHEVVVLCTDIDAAAEALDAVCARAAPGQRLALSISGRAPRADPVLAAVLDWLAIVAAGLPLNRFADWLARPFVLERFGLDTRALDDLLALFARAGASGGLDPLQGPPLHNWQTALDRLVLGAAMAPGTHHVLGLNTVAAASIVDIQSVLGRLYQWLDSARVLTRGAARRPLEEWTRSLRDSLDTLWSRADDEPEGLRRVREALSTLAESAVLEPGLAFDLRAFSRMLSDAVDARASAGLPGAAITVCPMGSLRAVPFRVACLFGFDEHAWPRPLRRVEYDLIAQAPRFGDRVMRFDERGAFLDALLATRERVVIVHHGRDARDDQKLNPSTLVTELARYVTRVTGRDFEPVEHPLHGFSPRSARDPARPAQAAYWWPTARALTEPIAVRGIRGLEALAARAGVSSQAGSSAAHRDLLGVARDLAQPAWSSLRSALGLRLPAPGLALDEHEPLDEREVDRRPVLSEALGLLQSGHSADQVRAQLLASPRLPAGVAGQRLSQALVHEAIDLLARLGPADEADIRSGRVLGQWRTVRAALGGDALRPRGIEAGADSARGEFEAPATALTVHAVLRMPGDDDPLCFPSAWPVNLRLLLEVWLSQALRQWARAGRSDLPPARVLDVHGTGVEVRVDDPREAFAHVLHWHGRMLREPLALFPRTMFAAWQAGIGPQDDWRVARELLKVRQTFEGHPRGVGERERGEYRALFRDAPASLEAALGVGFEVYGPVFAACRKVKAW